MKLDKVFITTLSKSLYDRYAYKLLESYTATQQKIPLYVYTEDFINPPSFPNVTWVNLSSAELQEFIQRNKQRLAPTYMEDGVRFCYKVFCQHAARNLAEKIFFLDADCIFLSTIPKVWFDFVLPDDVFTCFYDRPGLYTECGFVGFNTNSAVSEDFFNKYLNLYTSDDLYKLRYYTDCHAFDYIRSLFKNYQDYRENVLGQFLQHRNLHVMQLDPNINRYIDHKKGNRKYA